MQKKPQPSDPLIAWPGYQMMVAQELKEDLAAVWVNSCLWKQADEYAKAPATKHLSTMTVRKPPRMA